MTMLTKFWVVALLVFVVAALQPPRSSSDLRRVDSARPTIDAMTLSSGASRASFLWHDDVDMLRRPKARRPRPFDLGA
ncbi:MAG TPA: hypothetical protein VGX76_04245 [Pirellulales bacterium]|jgi:hypothetical protein|nr:hypothetical protein [Pirellulales bacterium]